MSAVRRSLFAATVLIGISSTVLEAASPPDINPLLKEGKIGEAHQQLSEFVKTEKNNDEAEFALGFVELLQAVETLSQDLYRYGLRTSTRQMPMLRLPIPTNPQPEKIDHKIWVGIRQRLIDNLAKAATTLEGVTDETVKIEIPVGEIRLDLNGDGKAEENETFWVIFSRISGLRQELTDEQKQFSIAFDAADVDWMIGYTHVVRGMMETWLGYDSSESFRYAGHILFQGAEPPFPELGEGKLTDSLSTDLFADGVASIHVMNCPVADAERLKRARQHFLSVIERSRESWKHCMAEVDDDKEWVPNAKQTSVVPQRVTQEQIDAWLAVLDHGEAVLNGELLIPHFRVNNGMGINIKRVFEEPRRFDLILWIHGAGAVPFLEEGKVLKQADSNQLMRTFRGQFFTFAIWFN